VEISMGIMNIEQGILNVEVKKDKSTFNIPCSIFDIGLGITSANP